MFVTMSQGVAQQSSEVDELKKIIALHVEARAEQAAIIEALQKQNEELRAIIAKQARDIKALATYIKSKTGATLRPPDIPEGQQLLFEEFGLDVPDEVEVPEHVDEAPDGETEDDKIRGRDKPKNRSRKADYSNLPRDVVRHELPESERICPDTGVALVEVGVKVTEELDLTPAELRVTEHHQVVYGPNPEVEAERKIKPRRAPLPPRAVEGVMASAALIAYLLVQKYRFHLPLYRQEEAFQQAGCRIPRQTLCDWVLKSLFELRPVARAIESSIRASRVLQLDDTPVKCQAGKGQGNFQAYLWAFVSPTQKAVAFRFTEGRGTKDLAPLLKGVGASILLGDAYAANRSGAREAGLKVEHAGCFAHVLRKFRDAEKEAPRFVRKFREDLKAIYGVEIEADEAELTNEERLKVRRERSRPALVRMLRRTLGWKENFALSGKVGAAIKYLRNGRRSFTTFLRDGGVPIDNNACERSIRPVAVGRRNWLFAGSVGGGEAAATAYTIIETCRLNEIDPREYIEDVLGKLGSHPGNSIHELLPGEWKIRSARDDDAE